MESTYLGNVTTKGQLGDDLARQSLAKGLATGMDRSNEGVRRVLRVAASMNGGSKRVSGVLRLAASFNRAVPERVGAVYRLAASVDGRADLQTSSEGRVSGHHGLSGTRHGADGEDVGRAKLVLDEACVELDNLLDGVEVGDADGERVLDNEEGHALGAGRGGERARVLDNVRGLDHGEDVGEVNTALNRRTGSWGGNLGESGGQGGDHGGGLSGGDLEHQADDDELGGVGNALVHHVDLERVVFAIDVVLGRRVHMELGELVVDASEAGGAVGDDFECSAQVLEDDFLDVGDGDDGPVGSEGDGTICIGILLGIVHLSIEMQTATYQG